MAVCTFSMGLCFDDLADSSWAHCILGSQSELVPGTTLEVLQPIGALTGTDGKVPPLLAVVLGVLQDVAWRGGGGQREAECECRVSGCWPEQSRQPGCQ